MLHNIITGVLLFSLLFTSNCFGKFTLLQKVHGINAQINVGEGKVKGCMSPEPHARLNPSSPARPACGRASTPKEVTA